MKKILAIALCLVLACGCGSTFYKHVDGEADSVGITLPDEETVKIQIVSHLNGEKTSVKDISKIVHEYAYVASNSYFGVIHVSEKRNGRIEVEPVVTNKVDVR